MSKRLLFLFEHTSTVDGVEKRRFMLETLLLEAWVDVPKREIIVTPIEIDEDCFQEIARLFPLFDQKQTEAFGSMLAQAIAGSVPLLRIDLETMVEIWHLDATLDDLKRLASAPSC